MLGMIQFFSQMTDKRSIMKKKRKKQVQRRAAQETAPAILSIFFDFTILEMANMTQSNKSTIFIHHKGAFKNS